MSDDMWTAVWLDISRADPKPSVARILGAWQAFVEAESHFEITVKDNGSVEWSEPGFDGDSSGEEGDELYVGFHTSSMVGGIVDFGGYITRRFPGVILKLREEWTGEEPGVESYTMRNGAIDTATVTDELPAGYRQTAAELADLLHEDAIRIRNGRPLSPEELVAHITRTAVYLRSLT